MKHEPTVLDKDTSRMSAVPQNRLGESAESGSATATTPQGDSGQKTLEPSRSGPHRITRDGIEYDKLDGTRVPDMTTPVVNSAETREKATVPPRKSISYAGSRSHEMNSLIGRTTRLQLKKIRIVKSIAFISNKGGVGKTHISTNMAFYMSRMSKKALLIDVDLGNSDVTSKLGFYCENTIIDLLRGKSSVDQLIYTTPLGFDIIAGEPGNFKLANLTTQQKKRFIRILKETGGDYDFVMYDLSAGISSTTLDFALAQDYLVIVTTPQDIVAGYSCLKAAFFRFQQLEKKMAQRDPAYKPRRTFRPFVVLNQVSDFDSGRELFEKIFHVARQNLTWDKNFHLDPNFLGVVTGDPEKIREAELGRFLYSSSYGASRTGQCFNFLSQNLVQYRDPNSLEFTSKLKRFIEIFMKSVEETKYAQ